MNEIRRRLEMMSLLRTTSVYGTVVTRWNIDAFEIGTLGREYLTMDQTVEIINQNAE